MPAALHRKLVREGKKKGLTGERLDRYVYGTLWKVENPEKAAAKAKLKKAKS
jgi:hypothetical protein